VSEYLTGMLTGAAATAAVGLACVPIWRSLRSWSRRMDASPDAALAAGRVLAAEEAAAEQTRLGMSRMEIVETMPGDVAGCNAALQEAELLVRTYDRRIADLYPQVRRLPYQR
jgi:hypothetical protein